MQWFKPGRDRQASVVNTSRQRVEDYKLRMWTSSEQNTDIVIAHHPLAVYVAVFRAGFPVLRASVSVMGTVISDNNTKHTMDAIELFDNGNGDPDITGDDGVYSRYVTEYPAVGRYAFTVTVTDNNNQAVLVKEVRVNEDNDCCGSKTKLDKEKLEKTGQFRRTVKGSVITLLQVPDSTNSDQMPPS